MGSDDRGLGPFLRALQARLEALPTEQVHAALLAHGRRLGPRERESFLAIFPTPGTDAPTEDPVVPGEDLPCDIESFLERLASGAYYQGWGWDHELGEERAWGDESWVEEMDLLFDAAADAFLGGDLDLARASYGRLLHAFGLEEDGEAFCGPDSPDQMVTTDVTEAKARYLRALYETTPPPDRPARLMEEMEALHYVGDSVNLRALAEARPEPLNPKSFLASWIEALKSVAVTESGFGREAARLLAEAVELRSGVDGLGDLARQSGRPQAFSDWVAGLERVGRRSEARAAAAEALERLSSHGEVRARIAERLGVLAAADEDAESAVSAWREAWRAYPSTPRLLALHAAARALGRPEEVIVEEADALDALWPQRDGSAGIPARNERLATSVLLLAGRVDEAAATAGGAEPLGWSYQGHPGPVAVPYLLVAGAGRGLPQKRHSLLKESWESIDQEPVRSWGEFVGSWLTGGDATLPDGGRAPAPPQCRVLSLSVLLAEGIARSSPAPADRRRWLEAGKAAVQARVAAILGGQHRGAYARAACLAVACAEALVLAEGEPSGRAFVEEIRQRYSRYPAFRRELEAAATRSSVVELTSSRR